MRGMARRLAALQRPAVPGNLPTPRATLVEPVGPARSLTGRTTATTVSAAGSGGKTRGALPARTVPAAASTRPPCSVPVPLKAAPPASRPPLAVVNRQDGEERHRVTVRGLEGHARVSATLVACAVATGAAAVAVPTSDGPAIFLVPAESVSASAKKQLRRTSANGRRSAEAAATSRAFTCENFQPVQYGGDGGVPTRRGYLCTGGGLGGWVCNAAMKDVLIAEVRWRQRKEGNKVYIYSVCDAPLPVSVPDLAHVESLSASGEKKRTHTSTARHTLFGSNTNRSFGNVITTANGRQELFQRLSQRDALFCDQGARAWLSAGKVSGEGTPGGKASPAFLLCNCQHALGREWDRKGVVFKCQYGLRGDEGAAWTAPAGIWPGKKRCTDRKRRRPKKQRGGAAVKKGKTTGQGL